MWVQARGAPNMSDLEVGTTQAYRSERAGSSLSSFKPVDLAIGGHIVVARVRFSITRDRGIDRRRPGVDAAAEIVEPVEAVLAKVLGRALAADAMVALEDERRIAIERHQRVVVRLIEQAGAGNRGDLALFRRPDVHELEGLTRVDHPLELEGRELSNLRVVRHGRQYPTWRFQPPRVQIPGFCR